MSISTAIAAAALAVLVAASTVQAQDQAARVSFNFNGSQISIDRQNQQAARFAAQFTATDAGCGARCIAPLQVARGVDTFDEPQVLDFLVQQVAANQGLMVDARPAADRARGYIPGSVNLPYATLDPQGPYWSNVLSALGAQARAGDFDFTSARSLLVYDTGPSSDEAGMLVRNLLAVGYPADKIKYYRGGMQVWSVLGFDIEMDQS